MKNNVPAHSFKDGKQDSEEETKYGTVKNVTHKSSVTWKRPSCVWSRNMKLFIQAYFAGPKLILSVRLRHLDYNLS